MQLERSAVGLVHHHLGSHGLLQLVAGEKLDRILHAHRAEVPAATRNAVVHGVAEHLLRLARQGRGDRRRDREIP
jgi:hypothetical protein